MQSQVVEVDATQIKAPQEQRNRERLLLLDGGMATNKSPDNLANNQAVEISGLNIVAGRLQVDTGYVLYSGAGFTGVSQGVFQAFLANGTSVTLLITTTSIFVWEPALLEWQFVAFGTVYHTTSGYSTGATALALNSVSGLAIGDEIGIILTNGFQWVTKIDNIVSLTITIHDPVPSAVSNSAVVALVPVLHGDPRRSQVVALIFPANEYIIISNGVDPVWYYSAGVLRVLPGLPTNTTCKGMAVFHECLLLSNMIENGTALPNRVRMSDQADPTVWDPTLGTGIQAIYDLLDTDDEVLVLKPLGPWLIAYRGASIMRASYIGAPNETLFWEYMVSNEGVQSQGAVADMSSKHAGKHLVVGLAGVYAYNGGYTLDPVGEAIYQNFLAAAGDFNPAAKIALFTVFVPDLDEVWIIYPSGAATLPNKMLRMDATTNAWFMRMFADSFVAASFLYTVFFTSWAAALGTWQNTIWDRPWDSETFTENVPSIILSPAVANSQLKVYDYRATTDNGTTISWTLTSKQWGDAGTWRRWERAAVLAQGDSVLIERSEDEGKTWTTVGTYSFGATTTEPVNVYLDHVAPRLQLRLSGTDPAFALRYADIYDILESEW